jgi:hypothetical protein
MNEVRKARSYAQRRAMSVVLGAIVGSGRIAGFGPYQPLLRVVALVRAR